MPNVYLSLDSHGGVLTDPVDVIPSIIRHVFAQPGNVSTIFDNVDDSPMFSVRELEANHGTDPALFVAEFQKKLLAIIRRYYPTRYILPMITYEMESDNVRYNVTIDVQEQLAGGQVEPIIITDRISIDPTTHNIVLKFKGDSNG